MRPELIPLREPLSRLPFQIGSWMGSDTEPFSDQVMAVLGVDEYVSRYYTHPDEPPISLYVGYYQSQREGDTIHSPMNCLPGAGWFPVSSGRAAVPLPDGQAIEVNRYVIQKGLDQQLVLYWYQSNGRVVASEYWSKIYMVYDAVRLNRSDAALVRVITPFQAVPGHEAEAERRAIEFVQALFPQLERFLPS
jgi:EpsI family protein